MRKPSAGVAAPLRSEGGPQLGREGTLEARPASGAEPVPEVGPMLDPTAETPRARIREGRGLLRLWLHMCRAHGWGRAGRAWAHLVRRYIHLRYGCHLSPQSRPADWINLPHPLGIVVGHGVEIGEDVTLYHGVTLGQDGRREGYPAVAPGATLFAGAVVLGPMRIGRNAVVGANSVVLRDVPDGAVAVGAPARLLPPRGERGGT